MHRDRDAPGVAFADPGDQAVQIERVVVQDLLPRRQHVQVLGQTARRFGEIGRGVGDTRDAVARQTLGV